MDIILQPNPSRICGHCSVAMITGQPLAEIKELIGHENGTSTKELVQVLRHYGFTVKDKLTKQKFGTKLPYFCLVSLKNNDGSGHWSVKEGDFIYCPSVGIYNLKSIRPKVAGHITHYLELNVR